MAAVDDGTPNRRSRAWLLVPGVLAVFVLLAVALSSFQQELGLSEPGVSARAAVAAAQAVDDALGADADYGDYSETLLVAVVARRNIVTDGPPNIEVDHVVRRALEYYVAVREAWQAELDGAWDPAIQGDPRFWEAAHPGLEVPGSAPLDPSRLRQVDGG
jgi:hypothetical protein